jgi:hypothetical protein
MTLARCPARHTGIIYGKGDRSPASFRTLWLTRNSKSVLHCTLESLTAMMVWTLFAAEFCGDHRRVISGRHLSNHGTDRETYIQEYRLSPDELIAKDFRVIQSSRRGYQPCGKSEWIAAIKNVYTRQGNVFAGNLQDKHAYLYNQGVWIFGDWDKALRAAGFNPERMRMHRFWNKDQILAEIRRKQGRNLPLYPRYVIKHRTKLFSVARRQFGSWKKALLAAGLDKKQVSRMLRNNRLPYSQRCATPLTNQRPIFPKR